MTKKYTREDALHRGRVTNVERAIYYLKQAQFWVRAVPFAKPTPGLKRKIDSALKSGQGALNNAKRFDTIGKAVEAAVRRKSK